MTHSKKISVGLVLLGLLSSNLGRADTPVIQKVRAASFSKLFESEPSDLGSTIMIQNDAHLSPALALPVVPSGIDMRESQDLLSDASSTKLDAAFTVAATKAELESPNMWSIGNLRKIFPTYSFTIAHETGTSADGTISIPMGPSMGLAPDRLECQIQVRGRKGGEGPAWNGAAATKWNTPFLTIYQMTSDCNAFFRGALMVNHFYQLENGKTFVLSENYLYVKNAAISKLKTVSLVLGSPEQLLAQRLGAQLQLLVKGLDK